VSGAREAHVRTNEGGFLPERDMQKETEVFSVLRHKCQGQGKHM